MPPDRAPHQKWANEQIAALVELGIDLVDAERTVQFVLANLPDGADPATYIFPADALWQDPSSEESVQDARVTWYAADHIPPKFKRILDAKEEVL